MLTGRRGAFGGPSLGPGPKQGGHVPPHLLFLDPCSPLSVCVCFNFLYGKMDKKNRERERYLTAINWPHVAPPCLFVYLFISCVERGPGVCAKAMRGGPLLLGSCLCASPCHPIPHSTQSVGWMDGGIKG